MSAGFSYCPEFNPVQEGGRLPGQCGCCHHHEMVRARAERDALQAKIDEMRNSEAIEVITLRTEIERLRADLEIYKADAYAFSAGLTEKDLKIEQLREHAAERKAR